MNSSFRHIALVVPNLREAEEYYQSIFNMELIGRETEQADGLWYTLPLDKGWEEAEANGVKLGMVALHKGQFVLALFKGDAIGGQVCFIGLRMSSEEITKVKDRLPKDAEMSNNGQNYLEFRDPYQIVWQISLPESEFRTSGDIANRWLKF